MSALEFRDLQLVRHRKVIVSDATFEVVRGSIHALLGHNGAGKTTLVRAIAGTIKARRGTIERSGDVAVLFVGARFPRDLTVAQIVEHQARLHAATHPLDALSMVAADGYRYVRGSELSTGMAQRVSLAVALISGASILVLDEPTTGLDPQGVEALRTLVGHLRDAGKTIVMCSHDLAQLELSCDSLTCLRGGNVTAHGSVDAIAKAVDAPGHVIRTSSDQEAVKILLQSGVAAKATARGVIVPADSPVAQVIASLTQHLSVREVAVERSLFNRVYDKYASSPTATGGRG